MDPQTTVIGICSLSYGIYTLILRLVNPGKMSSLPILKERFGASVGTTIHVVGHTAIPLLFGFLTLSMGLRG